MIAAVIVISSLLLAAAFTLAYLALPAMREQIERPKFVFQEQVQRYNRRCKDNSMPSDEEANEQ